MVLFALLHFTVSPIVTYPGFFYNSSTRHWQFPKLTYQIFWFWVPILSNYPFAPLVDLNFELSLFMRYQGLNLEEAFHFLLQHVHQLLHPFDAASYASQNWKMQIQTENWGNCFWYLICHEFHHVLKFKMEKGAFFFYKTRIWKSVQRLLLGCLT